MEKRVECFGWAARDASGILSPFNFDRRPVGDDDIVFKISHCGVCYGEVVWLFNKLNDTSYPLVPGHEIVGVVTEVGKNVTRFKAGDRAGVGAYCRSCGDCEECNSGFESYCDKCLFTFNYEDVDGNITKGGFCDKMVVNAKYAFIIPDALPSSYAAPLLCAGITVYSPMKRYGLAEPGQNSKKHFGVIGLGGLGHLAAKFGKALGHRVTVLSTSTGKRDEAINVLGVDDFLVVGDKAAMEAATKSMDVILDTASGEHPLDLYLPLLKTGGSLVLVGVPHSHTFSPFHLLKRRSIVGSITGGLSEIEEMLEFCGKHQVLPMIEVIPIDYINEAIQRLQKNDVRYRFVVDIENSLHSK